MYEIFTGADLDIAMAKAVKGAAVILMCYSRKYQDSDNCKKGEFISLRGITLRCLLLNEFMNTLSRRAGKKVENW